MDSLHISPYIYFKNSVMKILLSLYQIIYHHHIFIVNCLKKNLIFCFCFKRNFFLTVSNIIFLIVSNKNFVHPQIWVSFFGRQQDYKTRDDKNSGDIRWIPNKDSWLCSCCETHLFRGVRKSTPAASCHLCTVLTSLLG